MENLDKNSNKWLIGIIALLVLLVGFQSYLLFNKQVDSNAKKGIIQFDEKDLFGPDTSMRNWDPFQDFQRMQKRMDQFFADGFPGFNPTLPNLKSFSFGGPISQNLDLEDKAGKYIITLELPGLDHTNVDVSVEGQSLRISGDMERKDESRKDQAFFQSHQSQHFERYLTLPSPVKPETLKVDYENDELKISVDKSDA